MNATSDNPPAFPAPFGRQVGCDPMSDGMILRDWFASQAPMAPDDFPHHDPDDKPKGFFGKHICRDYTALEREAKWAYLFADALLAERAKSNPAKT